MEKARGLRSRRNVDTPYGGQWEAWWGGGWVDRVRGVMKNLRSWLAVAAALGESLAILDLKGVMPLLPEGWAVWVAGVPTFAALVVHVVKALGESLGKLEGEDNR